MVCTLNSLSYGRDVIHPSKHKTLNQCIVFVFEYFQVHLFVFVTEIFQDLVFVFDFVYLAPSLVPIHSDYCCYRYLDKT